MLASVPSAILIGVHGTPISVEVHVSPGIPSFTVVGLPDASCREARDRVRAAILSSGLQWPQRRVTVNLAPTGVRKSGAGLDLPIAVALLAADGQLPADAVAGSRLHRGAGTRRQHPPGTGRPAARRRRSGRLRGRSRRVRPRGRPHPPRVGPGRAEPPEPGRHRSRRGGLAASSTWPPRPPETEPVAPDLADVQGQALGRLAVEVAAAGGHHLLLVGPPGAGKTMLAERLPGLLPPLELKQAMEVTRIHSAAGIALPPGVLIRRPPMRAPHHSASLVSLIGGGSTLMRPGELSCAHHGVLFLDELGEFPSDVLDTLRQPLEEGRVLVCRARASVLFPARVLLVAAMNPCPCGREGGPGSCRCRDAARARYAARVSGPLLDRFDLRVMVDRPDVAELLAVEGTAPADSRVDRRGGPAGGRRPVPGRRPRSGLQRGGAAGAGSMTSHLWSRPPDGCSRPACARGACRREVCTGCAEWPGPSPTWPAAMAR